MDQTDTFYFYNTRFNAINLIKAYVATDLKPDPKRLTNAFGVRIDTKFIPYLLVGKEGDVEGPPIPCNWHADVSEFGAALRAVDLATESFTMIELGCGWGCWMSITGMAAKKKNLKVMLIGVEGDRGHLGFATENMQTNNFSKDEYKLNHGIASGRQGKALFPIQDEAGASWGLSPLFNLSDKECRKLLSTGKYMDLEQLTLDHIARDSDRIDLLHIDIQGGEETLIPESIDFLSKKVAYMVIGTHSRQIEGKLFDFLLDAGWILEIERPAVLRLNPTPTVATDGVQGWRNPNLLPLVGALGKILTPQEQQGGITLERDIAQAKPHQRLILPVKIKNDSAVEWTSEEPTPTNISYHWNLRNGKTIIHDGVRTELKESPLRAGETTEQNCTVICPPDPGEYRLVLTLVQEGHAWFSPEYFTSYERDFIIAK